MQIRPFAIAAALAAGLAALPLAPAKAQYLDPACAFPLFLPFCAAGVVLGAAATIVTAPVAALTAPPAYYGYPGYPYYAAPAPYYPGWRPGWRYRRWCWNHPYRCRW